MSNSNLVILSAKVFIRLNKKYEIRKIYFEDLIELCNLIKECNIEMSYREFIKLEYSYNIFFNFYEDYDGYIIKLANGIDIQNLENYFNQDIFKNYYLDNLLENINIDEIFLKKMKIKQG